MARRRQPTVGEQMALGLAADRKVGRVERAVSSALRAAAKDLAVDTRLDVGIMTLARSLGAACDVAETKGDPYAAAAASRELREVLSRLKLDPAARTAGTVTELAELLGNLSKPTAPTSTK